MKQSRRILYCDCARAAVLPPQVKREVLEQLKTAGVAFEAVSDLCELAARRDARLARIAGAEQVRIAACYPRAVRWLFHAAGAPLDGADVAVYNMRQQSAAEVTDGLLRDAPAAPVGEPAPDLDGPRAGGWLPWFPVIDYERCANCKQCLSFCLFGVYALDADGRVRVAQPQQCKTGCPACARVCPSLAIIFPKYDKRPVNGDVLRAEDLSREPVQVDVAKLLGGDACAALQARSRETKRRFALDRDAAGGEPFRTAPELKQMQAELDIPDDVLRVLPSTCPCQRQAKANRGETPAPDGEHGGADPEPEASADEWGL
ncbi:MAG: hypothetical protein KKB50_07515 [Planctomycetes bacterium]|nr:hypothetical protein [Planctomycetota bacterium]